MFHPEIVKKKIAAIETKTKTKLIEYPLEYSIRMYEHFQSLTRTDGKRTYYARGVHDKPEEFKYTQEEAEFIRNELYICACSFEYWFFRYFFIKDKANVIRRPDVLFAQQIFLKILARLDFLHLPIKLLILKARQLGMSTIVEAVILWIALHRKGSKCLIASAQEDKSTAMSNMVWIALERLPMWMAPVLTRDDRKAGPEFGHIDTEIAIQHGSMTKGIGRGETPVAVHLSELPFFFDPEETVEASLLNAIHENDRTFVVLEGTARRKEDWWHERWLKEREGEKDGRNEFICLFLPWYVGRDKYPTPAWMRNHPIPADWHPLKETVKQAADARLYVATTELLKEFLGDGWEMAKEQMWCWEHRYNLAKRKDSTYKKFLAEFASDEKSCFQSKKFSVFTQEVLDRLEESKSKEFTDYAIIGDGVDERFSLKEYQSHGLKKVDVEWRTLDGKNFYWKLIPLKETPRDKTSDFYLRVWEKPKPGYSYTVGIDIASGQGQNRTVFFVNRVGRNGEPDKEVALICSAWIASPETPAFANVLGIWYGTYMEALEPYRPEALIVPEVQLAVGDFISHQLDKLGYGNLYYHRRYDLRRHPGQKDNRRGWVTSGWSKQMMMEAFEHAIKSGWIEINSDELITELGDLESDESDTGKTFYDHSSGGNNDVYMAGGIAYFTSHPEQTIMERKQGNFRPNKKKVKSDDKPERESGLAQMARRFMLEDQNNKDMSEAEEEIRHVY
jgi:hypothetical protein